MNRIVRIPVLLIFTLCVMSLALCYANEKFIYPEDMGRDPFGPLIDKNGVLNIRLIRKQEDLVLNGIIYSDDAEGRIAVINNESFRVGDYIGNYKISKVKPSEVVVVKDGKKTVLTMEEKDEE